MIFQDVIKINYMKDNKKLTDEEIKEIIEKKYSKKLPHTKDYIREQLKKDPNYKCKFSMVKQDFIDEYYRSRENSEIKLYYDFSQVPEFIHTKLDKFILSYRLDNKLLEYNTNFKSLVINKQDPSGVKVYLKGNKRLSKAESLKRAKEINGNKYDYSEVNFKYTQDKIKIKCNKCGKYFYQTVSDHIYNKAGCPNNCYSKLNDTIEFRKKLFIERSIEKYGEDKYNYSEINYKNIDTKVKIYCNNCKKYFWQTPYQHLVSVYGCPDCANKLKDFTKHVGQSYGEIFVMKALENLNINYISQYKIKGEDLEISDIRNYILVDYYVEYNGLKYFIEVNGQQHYIDKPYFYATTSEFKERLKRDKSISDYSMSNNIIYIEIPYTKLQNYDKVFNIIKRIFINHEDVNTVIGKLPEIKYRKEDQDG